MRTLDQVRAATAYAVIAGAGDDAVDLARGLPEMLRQNGLLAVWAFCLAKGDGHRALLTAMLRHLRDAGRLGEIPVGETPQDAFLAWVGTAGEPGLTGRQLRDLTAEATAFAGWLKRAAEANGGGNGRSAAGESAGA